MKLKNNLVSRAAAFAMAPAYVAFVEEHTYFEELMAPFFWDFQNTNRHGYPTCKLKKGQRMLTYFEGQYVLVKISSVKHPEHDADGPIIRVSNGEASWRIDGDKYGALIG